MKKIILCFLMLTVGSTFATENCFLARENNNTIKQEGDCHTSYGPQSTFKIVLSLIGFDSGILQDANVPSWPCNGCNHFINVCKGNHEPRTWMRDSCLWYSQVLTNKLGMEKFQDYIKKFNYGNMDLSGEKDKNNGLTQAWISSSLKISPIEQVKFLQSMIDKKLPISKSSYDKTKKILFIQELPGGWKLYAKTGNGNQVKNDIKTELQHGWFVGYIEKNKRKIVFANHIVDHEKQKSFASHRTRNDALIKLFGIIEELESDKK